MNKELTCIGCPMGCQITADLTDGIVSDIQGNTCKIGERYAKEELTNPKRTVTALCRINGTSVPLAVKTDKPIDKKMIFKCLEEIRSYTAERPIITGDIIISRVCGTDVNIVATQDQK